MTSPGGAEVGRVSIRVVPDVSRFFREVHRELETIEARLKLKIEVIPDLTGFTEEVDARLSKLTADVKIKPKIDNVALKNLRNQIKILRQYLIAQLIIPIGFKIDENDALRELAALKALLKAGAPDVVVGVRMDTKGASATRRGASLLFGSLIKGVGRAGAALTVFGGIATVIGGLATAAGAAVPAVLGLVAAIAAAAPAAAIAIPALAGLAAVVATFKLATAGVGDAFSALAEGDSAAFSKALAKLTPAARRFVLAAKALAPAVKEMQRAVQETFFAPLARQLTAVGRNLLPTIRTGLVVIAAVANDAAQGIGAALSAPSAKAQIGGLLTTFADAFGKISDLPGKLTATLLQIATAAGPAFRDTFVAAGSYIRDFTAKIAALSKSGALTDIINNALSVAAQIGKTIVDVVAGIGNIVKAAGAAGSGVTIFSSLAASFREITGSTAGQAALVQFFTGLAAAGQAVGAALKGVVLTVLPALGSALTAIAPAATSLFNALGPALGQIITGLGPIIAVIGTALGEAVKAITPAIGPLANALLSIVRAAAPLLPLIASIAATVITAFAPAFTALGAVLGPVILAFANAIIPALAPLASVFRSLGVQIAPIAAALGAQLGQAFIKLAPAAIKFTQALADQLIPVLPQLLAVFVALAPVIVKVAEAVADGLVQGLQQMIPQIPALVDSMVQLSLAMISLITALMPILPPILSLITFVIAASMNLKILTTVMQVGAVQIGLTAAGIRGLITFVRGMIGIFGNAISAARSMFSAVVNAFQQVIAAGGRMAQGIANTINRIGGFFASLPGKILSAVGNLGSTLYNSGQEIIRGLIRGIQSMLGKVGEVAGRIASTISSHFPNSPAKTGPLKKSPPQTWGRNLVTYFADGMTASKGIAAAAAEDVAGAVMIGPVGNASITAAAPAGPGAAGDRRMELVLDDGTRFSAWVRAKAGQVLDDDAALAGYGLRGIA